MFEINWNKDNNENYVEKNEESIRIQALLLCSIATLWIFLRILVLFLERNLHNTRVSKQIFPIQIKQSSTLMKKM